VALPWTVCQAKTVELELVPSAVLSAVGVRLIIMLMLLQISAASCLAVKKISSSSPIFSSLSSTTPPPNTGAPRTSTYAKPVLTIHVLPTTTSVLSYSVLLLISWNQNWIVPPSRAQLSFHSHPMSASRPHYLGRSCCFCCLSDE